MAELVHLTFEGRYLHRSSFIDLKDDSGYPALLILARAVSSFFDLAQ